MQTAQQMGNQNQNNSRDNYFQSNIKRYGENFIHTKSPKMIQFDAKRRLFKDMVLGYINYDEYGQYFADPQFLDNLIAVATTLQNEHKLIATALFEFANNHGNSVAAQLQQRHMNVSEVFNILALNLMAVKNSGYNIQYLIMIASTCAPFKNDFSELY